MKALFYLVVPLSLLLPSTQQKTTLCKNGNYVLQKSISHHDPDDKWQSTSLEMVLREPRTSVPERFSNVQLDLKTGSFRLERNRGSHTSTHSINSAGEATTLLNDFIETDPELVKEYRLEPERNANYRAYYQFMYGLPMILDTPEFDMKTVGESEFNGQKAISIDFDMAQPMIASSWRIYFSPEDYSVLGIETLGEKPEEGEYLIFNGKADVNGLSLPRFRHWYDKTNDEYRGSDILVSAKKK